MSTRVLLIGCEFTINKENVHAAFSAVRRLTSVSITGQPPLRSPSWVDVRKIEDSDSLHDLLIAWRWSIATDPDGNVVFIDFLGEKLGDEDILFKALGPYVNRDSFITMAGDNSEIWRWYFDGQQTLYQPGTLTFE